MMGGFRKMKIKNILLFFFVFMVLAGLTLNSVSAAKSTKYSTHTSINKYYESDCHYEYDNGMYAWNRQKIILMVSQRSVKNIGAVKQNSILHL